MKALQSFVFLVVWNCCFLDRVRSTDGQISKLTKINGENEDVAKPEEINHQASLEEEEDYSNAILNHFYVGGTSPPLLSPSSTISTHKTVINEEHLDVKEDTKESVAGGDEYAQCMETIFFRNGINGPPTIIGVPGDPGKHGIPGVPGLQGQKGEPGSNCNCKEKQEVKPFLQNIRHCAWNNYNFALSVGKVQTCSFAKKQRTSVLRMEWHGSTRVKCFTGACCNRWYFNIDGAECRDPQPIDGLVYVDSGNTTINVHRSMSVVGICRGISEGIHNVTFWIGRCNGGYERGQVRTGWNSASRIIIEELPYH